MLLNLNVQHRIWMGYIWNFMYVLYVDETVMDYLKPDIHLMEFKSLLLKDLLYSSFGHNSFTFTEKWEHWKLSHCYVRGWEGYNYLWTTIAILERKWWWLKSYLSAFLDVVMFTFLKETGELMTIKPFSLLYTCLG